MAAALAVGGKTGLQRPGRTHLNAYLPPGAPRRRPSLSSRPPQAFSTAILLRCWHLLTPAAAAWLAGSLALAAADVAWRRYRPRSYLRHRELPAALLRAATFCLPTTWAFMAAMLNQYGALPGGMSWAAHAAVYTCLLTFTSGAAKVGGWGRCVGAGVRRLQGGLQGSLQGLGG